MKLIGIDFETTGIDPTVDKVIEMGYAIYDTDTGHVVRSGSWLVNDASASIPEEIEHLTGICSEDLKHGFPPKKAWSGLGSLATGCQALVAHNAEFELGFIRAALGDGAALLSLPVLDTVRDIPYPSYMKHRDLERLSLYHGCPNLMAHRALPDVLTMLAILAWYPWRQVAEYWMLPTVALKAVGLPYNRKDEVKALGFQWDGDAKVWLKNTRGEETEAVLEKAALAGIHLTQSSPV